MDLIHWATLPVTSIQAWNISTIPGLEKEERQGGREGERKEGKRGRTWRERGGRREG